MMDDRSTLVFDIDAVESFVALLVAVAVEAFVVLLAAVAAADNRD